MPLSFLTEELKEIRDNKLWREFRTNSCCPQGWVETDGHRVLNLCSNNYLGLADEPRIKQAAAQAMERYGFGSTASRHVVGNYELYNRLEQEMAEFKGTAGVLVFNSGFTANLGIIPALVGRQDIVLSDKLNHASIVDGIILSRAEHRRYKHRDLASLEKALQQSEKFRRKLIITDTIFSMDGDLAPLKEIVELKRKYGAILMVDEAHGGGVFGRNGSGLAEYMGVSSEIDINMGTFSKAFGGFGAYVAGNRDLIDFLRNKCRSLIYTTALPPAVVGGLLKALEIVRLESWRRERLLSKSVELRLALQNVGFNILDSESQIIPIVVGASSMAMEFSQALFEENILVGAIRPPTVPVDTARLRITLTAVHSDEQLEMAQEKVCMVGRRLGVI